MITILELQALSIKPSLAALYAGPLSETAERYKIKRGLRLCHFIAQLMHESWLFSRVEENLNYTPTAILKTFNNSKVTRFSIATANVLGRTETHRADPVMIASIAYANRMGNGDRQSGDGWRYRGRGLIQITGKVNYTDVANALGIDCVTNPDLLKQPLYAALSAGHYWNSRGLNELADKDDTTAITKKINGGVNGLAERFKYVQQCKDILL